MSGVEPNGPETSTLGDTFLAKPISLAALKKTLYAAANGARGRERRRQRTATAADRRTPTPAVTSPRRAPPAST
jgi:hypothetical protein